MRQKRILLRLVEPVNLIHKQNRFRPIRPAPLLCHIDNLPYIRHPARHRREIHERRLCRPRNHRRNRRFPAPRRTIKYRRRQPVLLNRPTQRFPHPQQLRLPHHLIQHSRTHPRRQRLIPALCRIPGIFGKKIHSPILHQRKHPFQIV